MDSLEFKITSVIEKATKFYQRKQRHNINFLFLPSARVPQQTQELEMQTVRVPFSLIHPYYKTLA